MGSDYTKNGCREDNCDFCKKSDKSYCASCKNDKYAHTIL